MSLPDILLDVSIAFGAVACIALIAFIVSERMTAEDWEQYHNDGKR